MKYVEGTKVEDLTGLIFGDILVKYYIGKNPTGKHPTWGVECMECGKSYTMQSTHLKNKVKGVGCGNGCTVRINQVIHTEDGVSLVDVSTEAFPDKICIVDTEDYHKYMTGNKWYAYSSPHSKNYYVYAKINNKRVALHKLICDNINDKTLVTDHINGSGLDNRRINLRSVTISENMRNMTRSVRNTSGVIGVSWHKTNKKWLVTIRTSVNVNKYLGYFENFEDAVAARKQAELDNGYHENNGRERYEY